MVRGSVSGLLTRSFLALALANLAFFFSVTMFLVLPVHLRALGADEAGIGWIMGSFALATAVGIPVAGVLGDALGRKPFLRVGYLLTAAGSAGFVFVDGLSPALALLRALQGLGFSGALVGAMTIVADAAPRERLGQAIGLIGASTLIAHAIGPVGGELVAARWGYPALFATAAALPLLSLAALALVRDPHRAAPAAADPAPIPRRIARAVAGLARLAARPGTRAPLGALGVGATAFGAVVMFVADYAATRGLTRVGPFFLAFTGSAVAMRVLFGHVGDRVGRRRVALPMFAGHAVSLALLAGLGAPWHLWALGALFGVAHGIGQPAIMALAVAQAGADDRGRVTALCHLFFSLGMVAASFGYGALAKAVGYPGMYCVAAAVALLGAPVLAMDRAGATLESPGHA